MISFYVWYSSGPLIRLLAAARLFLLHLCGLLFVVLPNCCVACTRRHPVDPRARRVPTIVLRKEITRKTAVLVLVNVSSSWSRCFFYEPCCENGMKDEAKRRAQHLRVRAVLVRDRADVRRTYTTCDAEWSLARGGAGIYRPEGTWPVLLWRANNALLRTRRAFHCLPLTISRPLQILPRYVIHLLHLWHNRRCSVRSRRSVDRVSRSVGTVVDRPVARYFCCVGGLRPCSSVAPSLRRSRSHSLARHSCVVALGSWISLSVNIRLI